ncbi:MAG: hypothetical protein DWQ42_19075 [Planctomycetota bacterium]|nr:MAG: hypothetical protein DWQ42_19075 [Planctomycetota bacterium]REK43189.1 MAG: hypothetical protein DWQ46_12515 [Planctomycetota bacterium]
MTTTLDTTPVKTLERFLDPDVWHSSAPGKLRRAAEDADAARLWKVWKKHLRQRDTPSLRSRLVGGKSSPLAWTLTAEAHQQTTGLLKLLARAVAGRGNATAEAAEQLSAWLVETDVTSVDRAVALEALAWAEALPSLSNQCTPEAWIELFDCLLKLTEESVALAADADVGVMHLLRGELPLTLGCVLPELAATRAAAEAGRDFLSTSILEVLDGEGTLHARYLDSSRELLACWTRCCALGEVRKSLRLSKQAREQYAWFITSAIRQCRHDGTQILADREVGVWSAALFESALDLAGDEADEEVADVALPGRRGGYEPEEEWPRAAGESEWASLTTLRSDWSRSSNHVTVAYDRLPLRCELNVGKQTLFSSSWDVEVKVDGRPLAVDADAEWEQVCWESDRDCDFLELELSLAEGVQLQRSFLLAHNDEFLLMSDAVQGDSRHRVDYISRLTLGKDVQVAADRRHTELRLGIDEPTFRVLPLGISEWRSDSSRGTLRCAERTLELRQTLAGAALAAPLFFDLSRRRRKAPVTWRQLTVGEDRSRVPPDVAVGYRVEIGKSQWLYYRSLAPPSSRTVLGQNRNSEILVGRFHRDGSVEELVEIE